MRRRTGFIALAVSSALAIASAAGLAAIPDTPDGALASPRVGTGAGGDVSQVVISGSGRYEVFVSSATNLYTGQVSDEPSATCEVFRRDLYSGTTIMVSRVSNTGAVGNGCSSAPAVDYDGNVIAFLTEATNLGASSSSVPAAVVRNISANTLATASLANGSGGAPASDAIGAVAISGDGTKVAFTSSGNLAGGVNTGGVKQVWVRDLGANTTTLASNADGSTVSPAGAPAGAPSLNEYGTEVAFTSASQLSSTANAGVQQVYLRNLQSSSTTLVSRASGSGGAAANAAAGAPSLDADGNAVAFQSAATNLGDTSGQSDDYVRSLTAATTTLVDTAADGTTVADAPAGPPSISAYGDVVAFASAAGNLGADPQGHTQVWLHDLARGTVTLASPEADGSAGANGDSTAPSLSEGGIAVGYASAASNLDPAGGDTDTIVDAYVRRVRRSVPLAANSTVLITRDGLDGRSSTNQPSGYSGSASEYAVAGDGLYVAYELTAPLTGETGPAGYGVYVRNLETGEVELVNRTSDSGGALGAVLPGCGSGYDGYVAISQDGRYVAFAANAGDGSGCQVYVRDRQTGTTTLESRNSSGADADGTSFNPALSANGQYLIFTSQADNLTANHPASTSAPYWDTYERNLQTGTTTIVSLPDGQAPGGTVFGTEASGYDVRPSVTDDGRYVVFESRDAQLEGGSPYGSGQQPMTYLRDMQTDRTLALQQDGSSWGDSGSYSRDAEISADGSTVVFDSNSKNLVPGHTSYTQDIYYRAVAFDPTTGDLDSTIQIASVPTGPAPGVGGTFGNSSAEFPSVSSDGQLITFDSQATNYGTTTSGLNEVWQRNTGADTTTLISRQSGSTGTVASGATPFAPDSSADGNVIAFASTSANLDPDGTTDDLGYVRVQSELSVNGSPELSGDAHDGSTLTCHPGSWAGSPSFTYSWLRGAGQTTIPGASSSTYTITDADVDGLLACEVTASNGAGSAISPAETALPDPPVNTQLPQLGGGTLVGQTATCTSGEWTATPARDAPSTFTYQWYENGSAIRGASSSSLPITAAEAGGSISCLVTASNAGGSTAAGSASFSPPAPVNIKPPSLSFSSTPVTDGVTVTCNAGTWTNNPTLTVSWNRNGVTVPDATSRQYLLGSGDIHTTVDCTEKAANSGGSSLQDSSNTTGVVKQRAPLVEEPPVPKYTANGLITCEPAKFSYAAPDSFTWDRDGSSIGPGQQSGPDGPGQLYEVQVADLGHGVSCHETETNSDGFSATAISGTLAVPSFVCAVFNPNASGARAHGIGVARMAGNTGGEVPVIPAQPNCQGYTTTGTATPAPPGTYTGVVAAGSLTAEIKCPADATDGCSGKTTLVSGELSPLKLAGIARVRKPVVLAHATLRLARGHSARIHLRLNAAARHALRATRRLLTSLLFIPQRGAPELIAYVRLRR